MWNLPNAITLLRLALVPVIGWQIAGGQPGTALALFVAAALSDALDGFLARRWNQRTRFGAVADPLADKLTMLVASLLLAAQGVLPWIVALAILARDLVIVGGALAYQLRFGHVEMAPSRLSKLNTALEFALLSAALALAAGLIEGGVWWTALQALTLATVLASGVDYVCVWGRKAAARPMRR